MIIQRTDKNLVRFFARIVKTKTGWNSRKTEFDRRSRTGLSVKGFAEKDFESVRKNGYAGFFVQKNGETGRNRRFFMFRAVFFRTPRRRRAGCSRTASLRPCG